MTMSVMAELLLMAHPLEIIGPDWREEECLRATEHSYRERRESGRPHAHSREYWP